jgi:hypothetical protein
MSLPGRLEFTANGNINPCRLCKIDTSADGKILECGAATDPGLFVSGEDTRTVPYSSLADTKHAIAGERVRLYWQGEFCLLEVSAAVARGDRLKPSAADGRGQTAAGTDAACAVALKSAAGAGEKIPVLILRDTV